MKQEKHMDIERMLRELPQEANKAMAGLEATPFLKARIDHAAQEKRESRGHFALPKWTPAVCCAALVLVIALGVFPMASQQPGTLFNSATLGGDPTPIPASNLTADLRKGDVFISQSQAKPGYRNIWSEAKNGAFPIIGVNGKYYRLLTNPAEVERELLTQTSLCVNEFTTEPSLSGRDVIMSNTVTAGSWLYMVDDLSTDTVIAAEVNGRMRLFQRVSFNGNALRGKESLEDTLMIAGKVIGMELTGAGTVTTPADCEALLATLLTYAGYESSGSISSKKALLIELDNGLVLQLAVKGDNLAACGVWSCPEFFEAFESLCD